MSVNSKMTAIADAIRAKTGGTGLLTLDDMAQDIAAIDTSENLDEVLTEQDSIIEQIQAALEGKAAASVETCTLTISNSTPSGYISVIGVTCYDVETGFYREMYSRNWGTPPPTMPYTIQNVVCGSVVYVLGIGAIMPAYRFSSGLNLPFGNANPLFEVTASAGQNITIEYWDAD